MSILIVCRAPQASGSGFNFYISPTGDDANPGTLASPKSITWLGTQYNYNTTAGWSTYTGQRVGVLPGTYTQGKYNGTVTTLSGMTLLNPGPVIIPNGSANSASPTYIGASDNSGNELSGVLEPVATWDFGISGVATPSQATAVGHTTSGSIVPSNFGNITISGIHIQNYGYSGITMGANGKSCPNPTIKNCEFSGGMGFHNDNPNCVWFNGCVNGQLLNTWMHNCYTPDNTWKCWFNATFSPTGGTSNGPSMTITAMNQSELLTAFTPGPWIYGPSSAGLPSGLAMTSQVSGTTGGVGVYNLNMTVPTISSAIACNAGWDALTTGGVSTPGYYYGNYNLYGTNMGSNPIYVRNVTVQDCGTFDLKASQQSFDVRYSQFECACGFYAPATGKISPLSGLFVTMTPPQGGTGVFDHNIVVGGANLFNVGAGQGQNNYGAIQVSNCTFYLPSTWSLPATQGACLQITNQTAVGATANIYNNLFWSDLVPAWDTGSPANGTMVLGGTTTSGGTSPNAGFTCNNNFYQSTCVFNNNTGGPKVNLATWQTDTGLEANSVSSSTYPFATTPTTGNSSSFGLASGSAALTAGVGGVPCGAIDGSGSVGCSFA